MVELGFPIRGPMSFYCDNMVVISIEHNPIEQDGTKHVEVD